MILYQDFCRALFLERLVYRKYQPFLGDTLITFSYNNNQSSGFQSQTWLRANLALYGGLNETTIRSLIV